MVVLDLDTRGFGGRGMTLRDSPSAQPPGPLIVVPRPQYRDVEKRHHQGNLRHSSGQNQERERERGGGARPATQRAAAQKPRTTADRQAERTTVREHASPVGSRRRTSFIAVAAVMHPRLFIVGSRPFVAPLPQVCTVEEKLLVELSSPPRSLLVGALDSLLPELPPAPVVPLSLLFAWPLSFALRPPLRSTPSRSE